MRVKQLGNGGGLDFDMTNSAFLVDLCDDHSSYLLFDCGFNIMERLVREEKEDEHFEISKIDYVFISHIHDDHTGNFKALIYYNWFKNEKLMSLLVPGELIKKLDNMKIFLGSRAKSFEYYEKISLNDRSLRLTSVNTTIIPVKGNHVVEKSHGLLLIDKDSNSLFISGDTKADEEIENYLKNKIKTFPDMIFHDYSNWNIPSKNVHACESDFEAEYSDEFKLKCIKYHTSDKDFNEDWTLVCSQEKDTAKKILK